MRAGWSRRDRKQLAVAVSAPVNPPSASSISLDLTDPLSLITVTISGSDFTGASGATIGGTACTSFTVVNDTTITCVVPTKAVGTYDVVVTNSAGSSTLSNAFEYWNPQEITGIDVYFDSDLDWVDQVSWTDQVNSVDAILPPNPGYPSQVASVFGDMPSIRYVKDQYGSYAARPYASGVSIFFVGKWTDTDAVSATPEVNAPLTVVGRFEASSWGGFGASAGNIYYTAYDEAGGTATQAIRGSGLNDGTARLIGVTHATNQDVKCYVGATQQGATVSFTGSYPASFLAFGDLGVGYNSTDGFAGDIGAILVVSGVISAGDLTKLNKWSRARFGTP